MDELQLVSSTFVAVKLHDGTTIGGGRGGGELCKELVETGNTGA